METANSDTISDTRQLNPPDLFDHEDGGPTTQTPAARVPPHPLCLLGQTSSNLHGCEQETAQLLLDTNVCVGASWRAALQQSIACSDARRTIIGCVLRVHVTL